MDLGKKLSVVFIGLFLSAVVYANGTAFQAKELYNEMKLNGLIKYDVFVQGVEGFNKIDKKEKNILTIVDFSLPSTEERMYVLDLEKKERLFKSYVSHGKNTGDLYAENFSNVAESNKSSLGFFMTEAPYKGSNGYSLRLAGLEKGITDNAMKRNIVVHGADYANPEMIKTSGRLGRSFGCFAVPEDINHEIIDTIKGRSIIYVYADKLKLTEERYVSLSL